MFKGKSVKVLSIGLAVYSASLVAWVIGMKMLGQHELSTYAPDWGNFGSFVGGVTTPILTVLGFSLVIYQINEGNKHKRIEEDRRRLELLCAKFNEEMEKDLKPHLALMYHLFPALSPESSHVPIYAAPELDLIRVSKPSYSLRHFLVEVHLKTSSKRKQEPFSSTFRLLVDTCTAQLTTTLHHILNTVTQSTDDEREWLADMLDVHLNHHDVEAVLGLSFLELSSTLTKQPLLEKLIELNEKTRYRDNESNKYVELLKHLPQ